MEAEANTLLRGLELLDKDSGNITASYPTTSSKNLGLLNHSAQFEGGNKVNNKKRSHTQLDSRKQVIAFQDRVMTINIKEAQHPLK